MFYWEQKGYAARHSKSQVQLDWTCDQDTNSTMGDLWGELHSQTTEGGRGRGGSGLHAGIISPFTSVGLLGYN